MANNSVKTLIVVGGGAAGFFCAVNAARLNPQLQVIILEQSSKLLSKVRISGGGRCNVTHACFSVSSLVKKYPRGGQFLKKTFHQFSPQDTIDWFNSRNVPLKTEADGRIFPESDRSETIIDCLLKEAHRYGVIIKTQARVEGFKRIAQKFELQLSGQGNLMADFLVLACGGYPKESMFDWLRSSGHQIERPVPSLFTFNTPKHPLTQLMGLSVPEVSVKIRGTKLEEKGPLLCTHWGLSGPAVLKLSAWGARYLAEKNWEFTCRINWLPSYNEQSRRQEIMQNTVQKSKQLFQHKNPFSQPPRLWNLLSQISHVPEECKRAELPTNSQHQII